MAKIGIVLATYNGEKYLSKMLDSLVAQTRPADLIVAVDDGSKDRSADILKQYATKLPLQITPLPQNGGHRAAFSKALELIRPQLTEDDLIALADQDDFWLPQKLEILEKEIEKKKGSLVFGDAQVIDADGKITHPSWRALAHIRTDLPYTARLAGTNNITGCLSLFRAKILDRALPIPEAVGVHDAWIALLAAKRGGITAIDTPVIQYRLHNANAVGTGSRFSFDETCKKQIAWTSLLKGKKDFLEFSQAETIFIDRLARYWEERPKKAFLFGYTVFFCLNRKDLFPNSHGRFAKVLFSLLGAPAVHLLFGNKK